MSYTLADLELNLSERRVALQTVALDLREQRDELPVEAERPADQQAAEATVMVALLLMQEAVSVSTAVSAEL